MDTNFDVIILAGGNSERMGANKMLLPIGDYSILRRTVSVFFFHERVNKIILAMRKDILDVGVSIINEYGSDRIKLTMGGDTRTESVENALSCSHSYKILIHDGARAFVSEPLIDRVMAGVDVYGSAVPALPLHDSIRMVEDASIVGIADRNKFFSVQTPQGFITDDIKLAYSKRLGQSFTDDSEIYAKYIGNPHVVEGEARNIKITTPSDYLGLNSRVGIGYDIHNLVADRRLILAGVEIVHDMGLEAHSDGDVVIHALIDSLLSAIGERDIGTFFPDTQPKYKNIASFKLLQEIIEIYRQKNYRINNISIIIIADKPRLNGYIGQMIEFLAKIIGISGDRIAISAKTSENNRANSIEAYSLCVVN